MNTKFSIGVVVAIVLQVSGFVWWTAQQSQTIDILKTEVATLTSRMAVENEISAQNNIKQLQDTVVQHDLWLSENYDEIQALLKFAEFTENKWASAYDEDPGYTRQFGTKPAISE